MYQTLEYDILRRLGYRILAVTPFALAEAL